MSRRAMDSPKFNPHWTPEMPGEENSQGASGKPDSAPDYSGVREVRRLRPFHFGWSLLKRNACKYAS